MSEIKATMAGMVFNVFVQQGASVAKGEVVVVLESMKMEIPIESDQAGIAKTVHIAVGDFVNEGDVLVTIS
ncbi:acetyl-CoA carboxylase biotin carboxyl carrier protein [Priestia aryabhattai B8W22]|uniref:biotin/lipoyl-containing protein n=1 Tax=Priestia aryabhattai TaxID=412384 RepID=UPI00088BAB3B|nr:acetyl-CoA carboxylase biotin carboxyl carrier protein [Priestia aryabhattai B8W22]